MIREFPVSESPSLMKRAEAWLANPGPVPEPRLAATVMFVRDGANGVEVFMLRRVATMEFAPSMTVFPGGGCDPRDAALALPWAGPPPAEWAVELETDEASARLLVAAAVREVFEECGVLLAGPDRETVLADVSGPHWHQQRKALLAREQSLAEVLMAHGLVLRTDLLSYRAHWVTPDFEPRRYDTRFFAAAVPPGQVADDDTSEADVADWVRPAELLQAWKSGEALMLPPTVVAVEQIAAAGSAAEFLAVRQVTRSVMPELVRTETGLVMRADLP